MSDVKNKCKLKITLWYYLELKKEKITQKFILIKLDKGIIIKKN